MKTCLALIVLAFTLSAQTSVIGPGLPGTNIIVPGSVTSGSGSGATGQLKVSGATSGTLTLSCADVCGTTTLKFPATAGSNTNVLQTDGSGNLTWGSNSASVAIGTAIGSGTSASVLYVDGSGNLAQANAQFQFDATNFNLLVGTASHAVRIGTISGLSTFPGIWFGDAGSPSSTNYSFLFDSSNGTILNTPNTKKIIFRNNNSDVLQIGSIASQGSGSISSSAAYFWMSNVGSESTTNVRLYADANTTILNVASGKTVALDVNATAVLSCTSSLCTATPALKGSGGFQSSDGTAGATVTTCTAFKNGLCVSGT